MKTLLNNATLEQNYSSVLEDALDSVSNRVLFCLSYALFKFDKASLLWNPKAKVVGICLVVKLLASVRE